MMADVDIGLNIPATFPFAIWKKLLVVMVELDKGPIPATFPPIMSKTIPDPSHHSDDIGRSLGFYSYGHDRSGNRSQTS